MPLGRSGSRASGEEKPFTCSHTAREGQGWGSQSGGGNPEPAPCPPPRLPLVILTAR